MDNDFNHPVYSKNVIEFVAVANEYCIFAEKTQESEKKYFIETALRLLSLLYLKATLLPEISNDTDEKPEGTVTEADWNFIRDSIAGILNSRDSYVDFFDFRLQETSEPVTYSISENMADIYQDLKDFLYLYRSAIVEIMNGALFTCELNFKNYWGPRLIITMRILHHIIYVINEFDQEKIENSGKNTEDWFISKRQKEFKKNG